MNLTVETFDLFTRNRYPTLYVAKYNSDGGVKRLTFDDIDRFLKNMDFEKSVTIMGLQQDTFEYFVEKYGAGCKGIRFCHNRLVSDWSALAGLTSLEYLEFFANYGMTSLWDMSNNCSLKALSISNCTKLHSIEGVEKAPSLRRFEIGEAIWRTTVVDSFKPLAGTQIEHLDFSGKKIVNDDLSFLWSMPKLKHFDFPTNLFTTEQVAWMVSNFPDLEGYALCAKIDTKAHNEGTGEYNEPESLIVGKRKPFLINKGNEAKIQRYVDQFDQLVKYYKGKEKP